MKKHKMPLRERVYPLLRCEMVPITDPIEIDALERRIRAAEKSIAEPRDSTKAKPRKVR